MKPSYGFPTEPLSPAADWPESWQHAHYTDSVEIWGGDYNRPYAMAYDLRRTRVLDTLKTVAKPGAALLDLAAAQGNFSLAAAALGYQVTWNDLRDELIDYVKLKSPLAASLRFVPGNILEIADQFDAHFDVALALEVIEHVAHPDRFLARLAEVVKPGGHIILTTPNGGYFRNTLPRFSECSDPSIFETRQFKPDADGHIFLLHQDEIEAIVQQANLELVSHDTFTNPLTFGHVKLHHLHRFVPQSTIKAIEAMTDKLPEAIGRVINFASITVLRRPQ